MQFFQEIIDKYYPAGQPLRDIYISHCRSVADEALAINRRKALGLDPAQVEAAAMLHDIGIFLCHAPSIQCFGQENYIRHGLAGAQLLRKEGAPEYAARVAERHTGAGLTASEILRQNLPLPPHDFLPESTLERLICYADKFYSKSGSPARKPIQKVRAQMAAFGPESARRFALLEQQFS